MAESCELELNTFIQPSILIQQCKTWLEGLKKGITDYNENDQRIGGHTNLMMGQALDAYLFSLIQSLIIYKQTPRQKRNIAFPFTHLEDFQKAVIAEINKIFCDHIKLPIDGGFFTGGGKLLGCLAENALKESYEQKVPEEKRTPIELLSLKELRQLWNENAQYNDGDNRKLKILFTEMAKKAYEKQEERTLILKVLWEQCNIQLYLSTDEDTLKFLTSSKCYIQKRFAELAKEEPRCDPRGAEDEIRLFKEDAQSKLRDTKGNPVDIDRLFILKPDKCKECLEKIKEKSAQYNRISPAIIQLIVLLEYASDKYAVINEDQGQIGAFLASHNFFAYSNNKSLIKDIKDYLADFFTRHAEEVEKLPINDSIEVIFHSLLKLNEQCPYADSKIINMLEACFLGLFSNVEIRPYGYSCCLKFGHENSLCLDFGDQWAAAQCVPCHT